MYLHLYLYGKWEHTMLAESEKKVSSHYSVIELAAQPQMPVLQSQATHTVFTHFPGVAIPSKEV